MQIYKHLQYIGDASKLMVSWLYNKKLFKRIILGAFEWLKHFFFVCFFVLHLVLFAVCTCCFQRSSAGMHQYQQGQLPLPLESAFISAHSHPKLVSHMCSPVCLFDIRDFSVCLLDLAMNL